MSDQDCPIDGWITRVCGSGNVEPVREIIFCFENSREALVVLFELAEQAARAGLDYPRLRDRIVEARRDRGKPLKRVELLRNEVACLKDEPPRNPYPGRWVEVAEDFTRDWGSILDEVECDYWEEYFDRVGKKHYLNQVEDR